MAKGAITCVVVTILVLGGVAVLIAWLADKMKSPTFYIDQGSINNYNFTTNNYLNATFTLIIRSHNRDPKYKIDYNVVAVSVYHSEYSLAFETLGPYAQDHGDDLVFTSKPAALNDLISDSDVAANIRNETKAGQLNLDVRVRAAVRYKVKGWKHRSYILRVLCSPVVINFTSGKTLQGSDCDVDRF